MLAALLLNLDMPGGVGKEREEYLRGERALENLRQEHFARQNKPEEAVAEAPGRKIYKLPVLPEIEELSLTAPAQDGGRVGDDELALLFIIAEI